jgi:hypothetical protein
MDNVIHARLKRYLIDDHDPCDVKVGKGRGAIVVASNIRAAAAMVA